MVSKARIVSGVARRVPKYEWLTKEFIAAYVEQAPAGTALPTERELAATHEVSRATVRQALASLESRGVVYRIQGSGTYTVGPAIAKSLGLTSFSEDIRARGLVPGSRVISADARPAGADVGRDLQLSPAAEVVRLVRVRTASGVPMCLEEVYLEAAKVPGLLGLDLTGSLYELLSDRYGIRLVRADQVLEATVLEEPDAKALDSPLLAPALRVRRIGLDGRDRPVERSTSLYRGDRYQIRYAVRREP